MKKFVAISIVAIGLIIALVGFLPVRFDSTYDIEGFARLPILTGGRLKPIDSAARNSLLIIRDKQTFKNQAGEKKSAAEWLLDVTLRPEVADTYKVFRIHNPDVIDLLGWQKDKAEQNGFYFSFNDLQPALEEIERQVRTVNPESQLRSPYERQLVKLRQSLILYNKLLHSFRPPGAGVSDLQTEYRTFQARAKQGMKSLADQQANLPFDNTTLQMFLAFAQRYKNLADNAALRIIPPVDPALGAAGWQSLGTSLIGSIQLDSMDPAIMAYARLVDAYRSEDPAGFNEAVKELEKLVEERAGESIGRVNYEYWFNNFQALYRSMVIYVLVFVLASLSWLIWPQTFGRAALQLLALAFLIHTFGLLSRMYIQERPPVTNLYSSAVFVGWVAVLSSLLLERLYRNGIGSAVAAMMGFCTLLIAHHLGRGGDTFEMMQAVLDSNFWLATHVVTVTIGYSATFLAGFLALIFFARGLFTRSLDDGTARSLTRMVYGTVCFALLFSFVGTVLGGIWADQSWGRFWGWDPKENGALMIVLWNALILHARWGRLVQARGLMLLALGGNIVTSWSWFGTNMLGVGLHSYGFTDKAFLWLCAFWLSQIIIIAAGLLPARYWRSPAALGKV